MTKKLKWKIYEKRNVFRNIYFHKALRRHIFEKYFNKDPYLPIYAHKVVYDLEATNEWIAKKIREGKPFMVARFGNTEVNIMAGIEKRRLFGKIPENEQRLQEWFERSQEGAGLFPDDPELPEKFTDLMLESCKQVDMQAMFHCYMDDYFFEEYLPQAKITFINHIEPWRSKNPWSKALQGKKVLVIHPFEQSIKEQYEKRKYLFQNKNVLPDFELLTLKAVQTSAGESDSRFETWFEALEYMFDEAMKKQFDIAIIGCGAYGFPLAAKLKKAGKQVIHMGGATQILFGIKGRRWMDNPRSEIKFNDAWTFPNENETPKNCDVVENHCYW